MKGMTTAAVAMLVVIGTACDRQAKKQTVANSPVAQTAPSVSAFDGFMARFIVSMNLAQYGDKVTTAKITSQTARSVTSEGDRSGPVVVHLTIVETDLVKTDSVVHPIQGRARVTEFETWTNKISGEVSVCNSVWTLTFVPAGGGWDVQRAEMRIESLSGHPLGRVEGRVQDQTDWMRRVRQGMP
jgi:hypothetical protein